MNIVCACILKDLRVITAGQEASIKIWSELGETCLKTIQNCHDDIIRKICLIDDTSFNFLTCSNDGYIKVWSIDGDLLNQLHAHNSFIFGNNNKL